MKKQILTLALASVSLAGFAQTAVNFSCNDCAATQHNLFSELDAGKVIVLCWVMPCNICVGPSLTTYNVVDSYQSSNPNTVLMYICDDYANTACASLNTWKTNNGFDNAITFSDASINMADYSSTGMPKIVVVGGANHTVFYNANNTVNASSLQSAIDAALSTGINQPGNVSTSLNIFPNPAAHNAEIKFFLEKSSDVILELFDLKGQKVKSLFSGKLSQGDNTLKVDFSNYNGGMYLIKLNADGSNRYMNVVISK